jgi:hypothetical protein
MSAPDSLSRRDGFHHSQKSGGGSSSFVDSKVFEFIVYLRQFPLCP